jgi:CSLREA domain-containing protein
VFVRDRLDSTTDRISVSSAGGQANESSTGSALSSDGQVAAFSSIASNLISDDTNGVSDVFATGEGSSSGLVVNTEDDTSDGTCNATHCSLREAINTSNASVGTPDTITFAIPTSDFPSIAAVSGGLPTITDPVTIDATTQDPLSTTPDVELDGSNAGAVHGFNITAGSTTIKGFVIDDFGADGIHLQSAGDNTIVGNWIGTDVSGQETSPNLGDGIEMQQSDGNQIGGTTAGERNIVSASGGHGIFMFESDDNSVEGNYVGTDVDGLEDFGNTIDGIAVDGGQNNDIGPGNVTSGNTNQGVAVFTVGSALQSSGNTIAGNTVGLGAGGAPLPNGGQGVLIASGVGNVISQNSISSNGALGINLAPPNGINANDLDDPDTGPNDLQNFPVLTSAIRGASTTVSGTLNSEPTEDYTIEFFASASCDGTHGEGTRFLGDVGATTPPGEGDTSFTATGLGATSESESITATATDEDGNTSEFSACLTEGGPTEDGIYVLDPDNPAAPDTQLVSNGSEPALSPAGTLFFTRDGGLWVAEGDGTDATELASSGRWASPMGGDVAFQRFLPVGEGGQWELFLMTQRRMITVTATDEIPANLRFLYFYDCGADKHPLGNRLGDGSGTSELEFDTGGACGSGEATGTVTVIASDGIDLSVERPTTSFEVERSVPVAAIPSPQAGAAYTDDQTITLHGSAYDHEGRQLPGGSLSWTSPDGLFTGTKTGNTVVLPPAAGALNGESYTVIMTATDEDGRHSAPVTTTIVVYTDTDQDGLTDKVETVCSSMNPNDPTDAFTDTPDGDGIPAIDDIHTVGDPFTSNGPCVAAPAYEAIINFDPDELNIPSTGGTATASVEIPYRSVSQIVGSSVRISAIDGISYTQQNTGWSIKGGQGVAKFAREPLAAELVSRGVLNRAVRITISGTVAGKPFSGDGSTFVKQG